jgi:tetratricopeptide (TPR) repeat protein
MIGGRYRVQCTLGTGGMAHVYRATDTATGRELAVKRSFPEPANRQSRARSFLEREFHTLAQLSHPRVIDVYDFGVDDYGPFYTMELLDGGDLKERTPCEWRTACLLHFDICSSLALVHSRRMIHGDISPRNVRCTREGRAKLIDFGAMTPMGRCETIVGTPAFVAPEVVAGLTSDARTDLYSLGATFYYTLTGQLPFAVYEFSEVQRALEKRPLPPSQYAPDIPAALDALVLGLLEVDPDRRPRTAFEVMQRISTIAGFEHCEHEAVAQSYLSTPTLVGRERALGLVHAQLEQLLLGHGGGLRITGVSGVGLSRMLDACVGRAKPLGATVLRLAGVGGQPWTGAQALLRQLSTALPGLLREFTEHHPVLRELLSLGKLIDLDKLAIPRLELQQALTELLCGLALRQPLVLAADDIQRLDDASCALLAAVAHAGKRARVLLIVTQEETIEEPESASLRLIGSLCTAVPLQAFDAAQTHDLVSSVFGDVPNVQLLSRRVFERAQGNARISIELLQHLIDVRRISYDRGAWTLPDAVSEQDLPVGDAALQERLGQLNADARAILALHALATHDGFVRDDYAIAFPGRPHWQLEAAIRDLVAQRLLSVGGRNRLHWIAQRAAGGLLIQMSSDAELKLCHLGLARIYDRRKLSPVVTAHHYLSCGDLERGLELLNASIASDEDPVSVATSIGVTADTFAAILEAGLHAASSLQRSQREIVNLRHWLVMVTVAADPGIYRRAAPQFLAQLQLDSGFCYLREPDQPADPTQRLMRSLVRASERHNALPAGERVYAPDEAIKLLARFVAVSLAAGIKCYDSRILVPLPSLIEPYVALSPLVYAVWQNTLATIESSRSCHVMQAHRRWLDVLDRLASAALGEQPAIVSLLRSAVVFGLCVVELRLGMSSAARWIDELEPNPLHSVNAMYLRKAVRLQHGDLAGADECRRLAELLAVKTPNAPMFSSTLIVELSAHALIRDVQGVKQTRDRIRSLAARYRGWQPFDELAEGHFQRLIGDLPRALAAVERCVALAEPDASEPERLTMAWPGAISLKVETLTELGRAEQAIACGERALVQCAELDIDVSAQGISRSLALAEAKAGEHERAASRMRTLIDAQKALGVEGMQLGASYEALVHIAAAARDRSAFQRFVQLALEQHHPGLGAALMTRYAGLLWNTNTVAPPKTVDFMATLCVRSAGAQQCSVDAQVAEALQPAASGAERAQRALELLCSAHEVVAGKLFLCQQLGLELAASQQAGELPVADEVYAAALQHFEHEIAVGRVLTRITRGAGRTQKRTKTQKTESRPTLDTLTLLGAQGDSERIMGVVVLQRTGNVKPVDASKTSELRFAVGSYLLRAGDASGVTRAGV